MKLVTHRVREPLGPLLLGLEVLLQEGSPSAGAIEMIEVLERCIKEEALAIEELLSFMERFVMDMPEPG